MEKDRNKVDIQKGGPNRYQKLQTNSTDRYNLQDIYENNDRKGGKASRNRRYSVR